MCKHAKTREQKNTTPRQFKLTPSIAVISGRNIITVHHISKHVTICK